MPMKHIKPKTLPQESFCKAKSLPKREGFLYYSLTFAVLLFLVLLILLIFALLIALLVLLILLILALLIFVTHDSPPS